MHSLECQFFALFTFQNGTLKQGMKQIPKDQIRKYFHMLYHVPILLNNSKAKLVVTVS